eukprot:4582717-Ditylum_brightwellii.AAC.1
MFPPDYKAFVILGDDVNKEITVDIAPLPTEEHHSLDYSNTQQITISSKHRMNDRLLHPDAIIPTKGSVDLAAFDLHSAECYIITPGKTAKINTGVNIEYPPGYFGSITSCSGLAIKHHLSISTGTIDRDYTGLIQ